MNNLNIFAIDKIDPNTAGINKISAEAILQAAINIAFFAASATAVIVIVVAGYYFVTSSGSPESTRKAKDMILYGIIGLVVIIIAFTVTQFVIGRFNA